MIRRVVGGVQSRINSLLRQRDLDELYQRSQKQRLDADEHAEYLLEQLDSTDGKRAETAAKTLVEVASASPNQLAPYMDGLVSGLTAGNAPEKTAKAISCTVPVISEERRNSHRDTFVNFLRADYSERADGWILETLAFDIEHQGEHIETIVPRAVELIEPEGESQGTADLSEMPDLTISISALKYLKHAAHQHPAILSRFDDRLLALREHELRAIRIRVFEVLARLSDQKSAAVSGEEFASSLSDELDPSLPDEYGVMSSTSLPLKLIKIAEITIVATPDCWDDLNESLLPLLASDDERVRERAFKSLLGIVGHHPSLPSNPTQLHDRLSELATEFQVAGTYAQQVEWSLNRLESHQAS